MDLFRQIYELLAPVLGQLTAMYGEAAANITALYEWITANPALAFGVPTAFTLVLTAIGRLENRRFRS